jgi:hypothetical protein
MSSDWLLYLAAVTGCQVLFALFYQVVLARLSTFAANRAYLLGALLASVLLPLVALPHAWAQLLWPTTAQAAGNWADWKLTTTAPLTTTSISAAPSVSWLPLVLAAYWLGVAYQAFDTVRSLGWLYRLSQQHPRAQLGRGWLVQLPEPSRPAFSFGRYVFLSPIHAQLSPT